MSEFVFTCITCENQAQAEQIGSALVEENLAACANIFPGSISIYKWEGRMQQGEEAILLLKTRAELFAQIQSRVKDMHSYDVPCILAFPVENGSANFLEWVKAQTT